jgi:signal recognition particle receptor subunit beta
MVVVSYSGKEINAKLVYYGPGLCGKTTNLEHIYDTVPSTNRGKMVSMKTRTERTLFFDFLPVDLGEMGGFKTRFLLYTVPGQVYYNATRKLVLRGVDAVVFVADSARGKMNENLESLENLKENLREYGLDLNTMPWVLQFNKRDLPDTYTIEEMNKALNPAGTIPWFEAVATNGTGVFETLKGISKILLEKLSKEIKPTSRMGEAAADARKAAAQAAMAAPAAATGAAATPQAATPPAATPAIASASASAAASPASGAVPAAKPQAMAAPAPQAARGSDTKRPAAGVRAAAPTPNGERRSAPQPAPMPIAAAQAPPAHAPVAMSAADTERPSFGRKLAKMFGFGGSSSKAAPTPSAAEPTARTSAAREDSFAPMAVPSPPRAAVVTTPSSTRISRVDGTATPAPAPAEVIDRRVSVPVTIELTAEEVASGARLRLVLDIDLTTNEARVERESRTGTR